MLATLRTTPSPRAGLPACRLHFSERMQAIQNLDLRLGTERRIGPQPGPGIVGLLDGSACRGGLTGETQGLAEIQSIARESAWYGMMAVNLATSGATRSAA